MSRQDLPRWIFASVADHFSPLAATLGVPYFVEGIMERTPDLMRQSHIEMRVTGPDTKELSKDYYHITVVINILLTSLMEMSGVNAYDIVQWAGTFQNEMMEPVPIYKYGTGVEDDQSLIGCLRIKKSKADSAKVYHFGQVNGVDRIRQSEVDAVYEMEVTGSDL